MSNELLLVRAVIKMTEKSVVKSKQYVLVAPDGGWGYMICSAAIIIFIAVVTFLPCFGLIFNDILKEMDIESTGVTLINGIGAMSIAIGGYVSSPLLKILSLRNIALIGALVYNSGVFLLLFVNSATPFFICQGLLQGIGIGILYNLTFTILNQYFVEKRLFAFSIIQTLTATFAMCAPQIIKFSLNEFGYRGTLLVVTAVGIQAFVGVALFQPVEWHMKKAEIPEENAMSDVSELKVLLLKDNIDTVVPIVKLSDIGRKDEKEQYHNSTKINTEIIYAEKSRLVIVLNNLFDLPTVKIVLTSISSWAVALTIFGDVTYTLIMPQAFYAAQWHENDVAMALSLAGFGDLATRGVFIILSNFLNKIGNQELYIIGILISTFGKLGMLLSTNIIVVYIFVVLIGVGRCFFALLMPLVLSDICPEKFTTVIGISLIFIGLVNIGLGPVVGVIRDFTDSYVVTFYLLTALNTVCMVVWSSTLLYKAKKRKNNVKNIDVQK